MIPQLNITNLHTTDMSLRYLLRNANNSDFYEEEAEDYLSDKGIRVPSMSRTTIYKLAWRNGWRPKAAMA
jgi:hypothetical protein